MQFGPFCSLLLVLITTFEQQLAEFFTPNEIVSLYCSDYPVNNQVQFFVSFVSSARIFLEVVVPLRTTTV